MKNAGYCIDGPNCQCGGDTKAVREGCGNWMQVRDITTQHPDDIAVDEFAVKMKIKLKEARDKGRSGWNDPSWDSQQISKSLVEHVSKGDPVDVANYCMFLSSRKAPIHNPAPQPYNSIRTWQERIEPSDHGLGVRNRDAAMLDEIAELRKALFIKQALSGGVQLNTPVDFWSHQASWRSALNGMRGHSRYDGDRSYWDHEIAAFDRAYAELGRPAPVEIKPLVEDDFFK